jgi:hypothetical protein
MTCMTGMVEITRTITMTDLFFRIAERALELAPTIQPMIAPLFASTSFADGEELLDVMAIEEQGSQRRDTSIAPTTPESITHLKHNIQPIDPAIAPQEAFVSNQAGIPPVERRATVNGYPETELRATQTPVPTPEQAFSAQSRYDTPGKNTQFVTAIDGIMQHELPLIERPGDNQEERRSTPVPLTRVQPLPAMPPSIRFTGQKAPSQSTEAVMNMKRGLFHDDAQGSRDGLSRATLAEQNMNETLQEGVQITQTTPAVHVTIGRIEVRANPVSHTQVQPQRQQAVPKAMSLDEYLKQSEKGGR